MKKLISLFASALLAASFIVAPVNAIENSQGLSDPLYAACEGAGSPEPTDILACNGHS